MAFDKPDPAFDEAEADQRLARDRRDIRAMLAKADNRMLARDHRAANAYYGQVGKLAGEGIAIDRSELLRARDATLWLAEQFRVAIVEGLQNEGITAKTMHPRFARSLDIMFGKQQRAPAFERYPQQPATYFYPDLPHHEFFETKGMEWVARVEEATSDILVEAASLLEGREGFAPYVKTSIERPQGDVHGLLDDPSWSTLELTEKGKPVVDRKALAPDTWRSISSNAPLCDINARSPSIMFSLLRAGARIPPHCGMINTRLICHLPLIVPGNGALRVGETIREWEAGKLLMFDDSIEHEAWNNANSDRLVLIFDVWRPELCADERAQICALFRIVDRY